MSSAILKRSVNPLNRRALEQACHSLFVKVSDLGVPNMLHSQYTPVAQGVNDVRVHALSILNPRVERWPSSQYAAAEPSLGDGYVL